MQTYTKTRWAKEEENILSTFLVDGIELNILESKLPNRTSGAIKRKALYYGYGIKNINGISRFQIDIKRRNRESKSKDTTITKVIGASRVAETTQELNTSARTNENLTDAIIANANYNSKDIGLNANIRAINILLSEHLPVNANIIFALASYIEEVQNAS